MREAFECFDDGDTGTIPGAELRKWLKEVGDQMSDEEVRSIWLHGHVLTPHR